MKEYLDLLVGFLHFESGLASIPFQEVAGSDQPAWQNDFLPPLDAFILYSMVASGHSRTYLEIGSGVSTRFVRQAIRDHSVDTRIVSIDPEPRRSIDALCDRVIRKPLEDSDLEVILQLQAGDILYIDGSHRGSMNSDVTVLFLEVLPYLQPGVLVQIHDIYLPYDYPPEWASRDYSEQYYLALLLLSAPERWKILLPAYAVTHNCIHEEFLSCSQVLNGVHRAIPVQGSSFWLQSQEPEATLHSFQSLT